MAGLFVLPIAVRAGLVPPYFCYLAGISFEQLSGEARSSQPPRHHPEIGAVHSRFLHSVHCVGGNGQHLGRAVSSISTYFAIVAGLILIGMGLHFTGLFRIGLLFREARFHTGGTKAGWLGAYLVGLAFAFGWTPCVGPVLAGILFMAGAEESAWHGALLLAAYATGIGIPFLLAAIFSSAFLGFMARFRRHLGTIEKVMGGLLVVTGILIMTGSMNEIGFWMQEMFPSLGRSG